MLSMGRESLGGDGRRSPIHIDAKKRSEYTLFDVNRYDAIKRLADLNTPKDRAAFTRAISELSSDALAEILILIAITGPATNGASKFGFLKRIVRKLPESRFELLRVVIATAIANLPSTTAIRSNISRLMRIISRVEMDKLIPAFDRSSAPTSDEASALTRGDLMARRLLDASRPDLIARPDIAERIVRGVGIFGAMRVSIDSASKHRGTVHTPYVEHACLERVLDGGDEIAERCAALVLRAEESVELQTYIFFPKAASTEMLYKAIQRLQHRLALKKSDAGSRFRPVRIKLLLDKDPHIKGGLLVKQGTGGSRNLLKGPLLSDRLSQEQSDAVFAFLEEKGVVRQIYANQYGILKSVDEILLNVETFLKGNFTHLTLEDIAVIQRHISNALSESYRFWSDPPEAHYGIDLPFRLDPTLVCLDACFTKYEARGSNHSKTLVVDRKLAIVQSGNFKGNNMRANARDPMLDMGLEFSGEDIGETLLSDFGYTWERRAKDHVLGTNREEDYRYEIADPIEPLRAFVPIILPERGESPVFDSEADLESELSSLRLRTSHEIRDTPHSSLVSDTSRAPSVSGFPVLVLTKKPIHAIATSVIDTPVTLGILSAINSAESKIEIAQANINSPVVIEALKRALDRGVRLKIVCAPYQNESRKIYNTSRLSLGQTNRQVYADLYHYADERGVLEQLDLKWQLNKDMKFPPPGINGCLHTKTVIVDDCVAVTGSYNLDMQSLYSGELSVATYDPEGVDDIRRASRLDEFIPSGVKFMQITDYDPIRDASDRPFDVDAVKEYNPFRF
jgi:phosphatidylserine/phosphatidylglycerophosphate/cardiolipin synthase-like enzyme